MRDAAARLEDAGRTTLVGLAHSHPFGPLDCSPTDVANWRAQAADLDHRFVGLVISPDKQRSNDPWYKPAVRAWVAESGDVDHAPVTEVDYSVNYKAVYG